MTRNGASSALEPATCTSCSNVASTVTIMAISNSSTLKYEMSAGLPQAGLSEKHFSNLKLQAGLWLPNWAGCFGVRTSTESPARPTRCSKMSPIPGRYLESLYLVKQLEGPTTCRSKVATNAFREGRYFGDVHIRPAGLLNKVARLLGTVENDFGAIRSFPSASSSFPDPPCCIGDQVTYRQALENYCHASSRALLSHHHQPNSRSKDD